MSSRVVQAKIALITGITGQDGSYLAELLLKKGYDVHGIIRRSSQVNTKLIESLVTNRQLNKLTLHYGDLTHSTNIIRIIKEVKPDEIYNLGAQSHVKVSFESPEYTAQTDALGPLRILEAVRILGLTKKTKIYQASTSELYGLVQEAKVCLWISRHMASFGHGRPLPIRAETGLGLHSAVDLQQSATLGTIRVPLTCR